MFPDEGSTNDSLIAAAGAADVRSEERRARSHCGLPLPRAARGLIEDNMYLTTSAPIDLAAKPSLERRRSLRLFFSTVVPALLGRAEGLVVDISGQGARLRHFTSPAAAREVRFVLRMGEHVFITPARVLATRVVSLGDGPQASVTYESRVRFEHETAEQRVALHEVTSHLSRDRQSGDHEEGFFVSCHFGEYGWARTWSRSPAQPIAGFTVPASLGGGEIEMLCQAYERADDPGRELIRLTAAEVLRPAA
jgi:hypothetical protein